MPRTPSFPASIDAHALYVGGTTCSPTAKPGVVDIKNLIIKTYGNRWWGIVTSCTARVTEHKEGRALDIAFDATSYTSRKNANDFLYWLLRPDRHGNGNAMARRLGVMYVIWNARMWRAYRPWLGWQPYTGTSNPHKDHIHISLSWRGARRQTSWWTMGGGALPPQPPSSS
ncbi:hypothetical protein [Actinopolymorpha alba]|uniref:hypothetical protein n=1 Tax=Actinopolymorpha alba TaxID=533267 RepID=UPI00036F5641|nr:hypothetical protein [Actinopolymorpha alba]